MVISPQQANHYSYILPACMKGTTERKLYMNVAYWALKQSKPVCSQSIAENFGISVRQATNILSIIHRRYGDVIESTIKKVKGKGVARTYMTVTSISPKARKVPERRKTVTTSNTAHTHWKNLFLTGGVKAAAQC